ncbi:MAG: anti-sigma factor [Solirubrobacteraceae bacterium]
MSNTPGPTEHRECGDDVAAYALGALDGAELASFRRHLDACAICRDELAAFEAVVELLPESAPAQRAPAGLRRSVLREVRNEPKAAAERARRPRRSLLPRPALAFGAALALAVVAVAGVELSSPSSNVSTRVIRAQVTGHGTAQLRVSGSHAELVVHDFQPPPAGQIYEVWLQRGRALAPTSALFSVTAKGDGDVEVPGSLHGVSAVMVTPEPAGGTTVPTHAPVIAAYLS